MLLYKLKQTHMHCLGGGAIKFSQDKFDTIFDFMLMYVYTTDFKSQRNCLA